MHVSESEYISMRLRSHISNIQFHIYRSDIQDVSDTIKKKKNTNSISYASCGLKQGASSMET